MICFFSSRKQCTVHCLTARYYDAQTTKFKFIFLHNLPVWFLIFKNAFQKQFPVTMIWYDVMIDASNCRELQKCFDNFHRLYLNNNLTININKYNNISFYRTRPCISFHYSINILPLVTVSIIKHLDIIFSTILSFNKHINCICSRSVKILRFIQIVTLLVL